MWIKNNWKLYDETAGCVSRQRPIGGFFKKKKKKIEWKVAARSLMSFMYILEENIIILNSGISNKRKKTLGSFHYLSLHSSIFIINVFISCWNNPSVTVWTNVERWCRLASELLPTLGKCWNRMSTQTVRWDRRTPEKQSNDRQLHLFSPIRGSFN